MLFTLCALMLIPVANAIACAPGFTCFQEPNTNRVWVIKNDGNLFGPSCNSVCSTALCSGSTYYSCDAQRPVMEATAFNTIVAAGLGFTCERDCEEWGGTQGMMWASRGTASHRKCFYPANVSGTYDCHGNPGAANCWGDFFSMVCPCVASALDQSCPAQLPSKTAVAQWSPPGSAGTTCLERINYWRQYACAHNWTECPPCGLPPMTECVSCHECANSQADYDSVHGAHASFGRCGDMNQGAGIGDTCAAVIDGFVSERHLVNGKMVCDGHCGPILAPGCQTFFWGRSQTGFHTLNWGTCNTQACDAHCNDPTKTSFGDACRTDQWSYNADAPTSSLSSPPPTAVTVTRTPTRTPTQTPTTRLPTRTPTLRPSTRLPTRSKARG